MWKSVSDIAAATREGRFEPTVFFKPAGASPSGATDLTRPPAGFWAFASVQVAASDQHSAGVMSEGVDRFFGANIKASGEATLRGEISTSVRKER